MFRYLGVVKDVPDIYRFPIVILCYLKCIVNVGDNIISLMKIFEISGPSFSVVQISLLNKNMNNINNIFCNFIVNNYLLIFEICFKN